MFVMCFGPGGCSASSSSPSASVRAHAEGPSDLLLETPYYNFYQPSRYPTYYGNLYNYQQYQVTNNDNDNNNDILYFVEQLDSCQYVLSALLRLVQDNLTCSLAGQGIKPLTLTFVEDW